MIKFFAGVAVGSAVVGTAIAAAVGVRNAYVSAMEILDNDDTWTFTDDPEPVP